MTRQIKILLTLACSLALLFCSIISYAETLPIGFRQSAIVDGIVDNEHLSVGCLGENQDVCTKCNCVGTLIGNKTVLTAAHCINKDQKNIWFCLNGQKYMAAKWVLHQVYTMGTNDIGLVILDNEPPEAPDVLSTLTVEEGMKISLVGYGWSQPENNDSGVRRAADNYIAKVEPTTFSYNSDGGWGTICHGDSGGPTYVEHNGIPLVIGIHSFEKSSYGLSDCQSGTDMRVDSYIDWIKINADGDVAMLTTTGCAFSSPLASGKQLTSTWALGLIMLIVIKMLRRCARQPRQPRQPRGVHMNKERLML